MTNNDPAVSGGERTPLEAVFTEHREYVVIDDTHDWATVLGLLMRDDMRGYDPYRMVPCDADGNVTPEGARALFPELAQAVDLHHAWPTRGVDPVLTAATRVFTLPDQPDQEDPE